MADRAGSDPLDGAVDGKFKSPIPRAALKGDSLIRVNGIEGDLDGWVRIGAVQKMADGSYRMAGTSDRPFDRPREAGDKQEQQAPQQQPEPSERLDQAVEDTINEAVNKLGAQRVSGLFEHTVRGNDVSKLLPEMASTLGVEPEKAQALYDSTVTAFVRQAQTVAASVGVDATAFEDFCEWARTERPNEKRKAEADHFEHGRTGGVRALAREYAESGRAFDEASLEHAELGDGVKVWRDSASGKLVLSANGQSLWLREAVRLGVVKVSKSKR